MCRFPLPLPFFRHTASEQKMFTLYEVFPSSTKWPGLSARTVGLNIKASYRIGSDAKCLTAHIVQGKKQSGSEPYHSGRFTAASFHDLFCFAVKPYILATLEHDFLVLHNKPVLDNRIDIVSDVLVILRHHIIPLPIRLQCHKFRMGLFITSANAIFRKDFPAPSFRKNEGGIKVPNPNDFPESAKKGLSFQPFPRDKLL